MKRIFCFAAIIWALASSGIADENATGSVTLPTQDPMTVLMVPDGIGQQKISVAVSQAFVAEQWDNLGWDHNVTMATTEQSRVQLKVFAVTGAVEVKFYVAMSTERNVPEDRMKKVALKQVRALEKTIAEKLKLEFKPAKGDSNVDSAAPN